MIRKLKKYAQLDIAEQRIKREEIVKAFKGFWNQNPTEKEFEEAVDGLVLFPAILYYMIIKPKEMEL